MKFNSIILCILYIYVPKIFAFSSFMQLKLRNPTQSKNGGGEQMYDRNQQAAEHIFLPFSHEMTFFEHQNPYVVYPTVQDEFKEKKKENEDSQKDHMIFHQGLDEQLKNSMKSLSQKIKFSQITSINNENNTFNFKLNPHIGSDNENSNKISEILKKSEALSQENEKSKSGKFLNYAGDEFNKTLNELEKNSNFTVGDQLSAYENIQNLKLSDDFLNKKLMTRDVSNLDSSKKTVEEKIRLNLINRNMEKNGYNGLQSMFAGNKMFTDYNNKTLYNGWIDPREITYFDKLYMEGYYDDIVGR